jgi:hypothetical protein
MKRGMELKNGEILLPADLPNTAARMLKRGQSPLNSASSPNPAFKGVRRRKGRKRAKKGNEIKGIEKSLLLVSVQPAFLLTIVWSASALHSKKRDSGTHLVQPPLKRSHRLRRTHRQSPPLLRDSPLQPPPTPSTSSPWSS